MNIWYANHYSGSIEYPKVGRSFYLSKSLLENGVNTSVICSSYHHHIGMESVNLKKPFHEKVVDGIKFVWIKAPRYAGNGFSRLINMIFFSFSFWKIDFVEKKILPKPDAIIISSVHPFHIFAGAKWAKKFNAKLIFEIRDIWPLSLQILLNKSYYHPLIILLSMLEKYAYKKADLIISPLKNAHTHVDKIAGKTKEFLYLPNGFLLTGVSNLDADFENQLIAIRKKYKFILMHTGSMGTPNGLEIVIQASNSLKDNPEIAFVFIGDGEKKEELMASSNSGHVYFFNRIPRNQVQKALEFCDAGYCGSQNVTGLYDFGISPNKIFNYMFAKKPVLLGIDSPGNPVEEANAGICFKPENKEVLVNAINELKEKDCNNILLMGENGHNYLHKFHNFNFLAQNLYKHIKNTL